MRFVPAALAITLALGLPLPVQAVNTVELRGRLTDVVGTPLPGLHVVFRNPTTGVEFKARTDGDGRYRLVNLPVRQYLVLVHRADGRLLFSQPSPAFVWPWPGEPPQLWDWKIDPDLDCTVTDPATLEGVVEDEAGLVLPGVTVRLRNSTRPCTQPEAITDIDGKFKLTGLKDGDYTLSTELDGFVFADERIHLEPGTLLRLELQGRLALMGGCSFGFPDPPVGRNATGRVFDIGCYPLAGVRVTLESTDDAGPISVTTAPDGSFKPPRIIKTSIRVEWATVKGANPRYRLRFEHPAMRTAVLDLERNSAGYLQNWNVRLRPRHWLHRSGVDEPAMLVVSTAPPAGASGQPTQGTADLIGNVVDDHGCPVLGALVTARDRATGRAWSVKANGMGFRFAGLPAGYFDLTVVKKSYLPVLVDAEPLGFSESLWSVTLLDE
jgi:hypothetical protein